MPKLERFERYRELIELLGMTQIGAAKFMDIGERTSRRWAVGDVEVPLAVLMLLETMVRERLTPQDVRILAGMPDKRADYSDQRRLD